MATSLALVPPSLLPEEDVATITTSHPSAAVVDAIPAVPLLAAMDPVLTAVPPVRTAAVATTTAEERLPLGRLATAQTTPSQPLLALLSEHLVHIQDDNLGESLVALDALICACERALDRQAGRAPGFYSRTEGPNIDALDGRTWSAVDGLPYETLDMNESFSDLPVPSIYSAWHVYQTIRNVLTERWQFLQEPDEMSKSKYCSCISNWEHVEGNIGMQLVNQCLEQLMVDEASHVLYRRIQEMGGVDAYNASYDNVDGTKSVKLSYASNIPVRLLLNRDLYLASFTRACLAAKEIIQISSCYLFFNDPAPSYILFDLLPYMVKRGVKVQVLLDLMVMESNTFKNAFYATKEPAETTRKSADPESVTGTSFWQHLPKNCALPEASHRKFASADEFFQALMAMTTDPNFDVQFWCARDAQEHYRIKNHAKCAVFDKKVAILGGSNLSPTVKSANADLDILVAGSAAAETSTSFESIFYAMKRSDFAAARSLVVEEKKDDNDELLQMVRECQWDDSDCKVAILRSTPSVAGDDIIYRVVLEKVRSATSDVFLNMGHSSFPLSFARAAKEATDRGVRVGIMVNSIYSNDLRTGQADLLLSLRDLLKIAPQVEVYATSMPCVRDPSQAMLASERPEFLHAKYVTVDGNWSAVGSWNFWSRSAFYEIEHEAFVESTKVSQILREKFLRAADILCTRLEAQDCEPGGLFCPKGCFVCQGFGPFNPKE